MSDRLSVPARAAGLVRRRRPVLLAAGLSSLGLLLAGCGSTSASSAANGTTISGSTLDIWVSQPPGDSGGQVASQVLAAERMAFDQSSKRVGGFRLVLKTTHAYETSQDARNVVSDKSAIAYLGEIQPGTSGVSLQITNELGILQVSPTDTAAYLSQKVAGVAGSPGHFYPASSSYSQTFGRVVATTAAEATALVNRMKSDGVSSLQVEHDATDYGIAVAGEVTSAARAAGLTVSGSGAGAVLYAGLPTPAAAHALDAAAARDPKVKLYAPSALYDDTFVHSLSPGAQQALTVSSPGVATNSLGSVGRQFVSAFQSAHGQAPVPQAIFGYEAMRAVLAALAVAGNHAAVRATVVTDFRDLSQTASQSAIGAYHLTRGQTNLSSFVFAHVSGGALAVDTAG